MAAPTQKLLCDLIPNVYLHPHAMSQYGPISVLTLHYYDPTSGNMYICLTVSKATVIACIHTALEDAAYKTKSQTHPRHLHNKQ